MEGCNLPVDVVLRSCDKVLIGAHKANLDNFSDGFPPCDLNSDDRGSDAVEMTENSDTVKRLLHYVHKEQYPDVSCLLRKDLFRLADAAEKYVIHPAMGVCNMYILWVQGSSVRRNILKLIVPRSATVEKYPTSTLAYSFKHNYPKIADMAAPLTVFNNLDYMKLGLKHDGALFAWVCSL